MKKILTIFLVMVSVSIVAQVSTIVRIPSEPVTIIDPETIDPGILLPGYSVEEVEGVKYLKVSLAGWGVVSPFPEAVISEEATHFRVHARYVEGSSGVPAENAQTIFQLFSPDWGRVVGMAYGESSADFMEFSGLLDFKGNVGNIQVAAQDIANEYAPVFGGFIYMDRVEAYKEGTPTYYLSFDSQENYWEVIISSEVSWSLSPIPDWLTFDKTSGSGDDVVWLTVAPLADDEYRTAEVDIIVDGYPDQKLVIEQGVIPQYHQGDIEVLRNIRDNSGQPKSDLPLQTLWSDDVSPDQWEGVSWSNNVPRRVIGLYVVGKGVGSPLDVTLLEQLTTLICYDNHLTALEISNLEFLHSLHASGNNLTTIDLTGLRNLRELVIGENQIESLDLNGLLSLTGLYCEFNLLKTLDLTPTPYLGQLNAPHNKLSSLKLGDAELSSCHLENNRLPLSELPLPDYISNYSFANQTNVFERMTINPGETIDYSSEEMIGENSTIFNWYKNDQLIEGEVSPSLTPIEEGFYFCRMTNATFPGLIVETSSVKVGDPVFDYHPGDLAVLLKIRDDLPPWSTFRAAWEDEYKTGSWPNVTWDKIVAGQPKRVTELNLNMCELSVLDVTSLSELRKLNCGYNQLETLSLAGMEKLEYLDCAYNQLESLLLSGLEKLEELFCYGNKLKVLDITGLDLLLNVNCNYNQIPFSGAPLANNPPFVVNMFQNNIYQDYVYIEGIPISYPDEVEINGVQTMFNWYKNNELILANDITGSFLPDGEGVYYCSMTNDLFPNLTLITDPVKIGTFPEYDPDDVARLIAIRDASPESSYLRWAWRDINNIGSWNGVEWDFGPKKVKSLSLSHYKFLSLEISGFSKIENFSLHWSTLESLIVKELPELESINGRQNSFPSVTLDQLPKLTLLTLADNELEQIDFSGLPNLQYVNLENNLLARFEASDLPSLDYLRLNNNYLERFEVSDLPSLSYLWLNNNYLARFEASDLPSLGNLTLNNNLLTDLDLSEIPSLYSLNCSENKLVTLKIGQNLKMEGEIYFDNNYLPFSQMPIRQENHWYFEYNPQGKVFPEMTLPVKVPIDYSSEALINGIPTGFKWYCDGNLIEGTDNSGILIPMIPGVYYCEMTNDNYPGLVLTTNNVTVEEVPFEMATISGTCRYHRVAPLTEPGLPGVNLQFLGSTSNYTVTTDEKGFYSVDVEPGTYTVVASYDAGFAGAVNALDAGLANAWSVYPDYSIEKSRFRAGDVNRDNIIRAGDAAIINRYFLTSGNPPWEKALPWSFWIAGDDLAINQFTDGNNPVINADMPQMTVDFYGVVTGDFNLSMPQVVKSGSATGSVKISDGQTMETAPGSEINIPVITETAMTVGAFSLILSHPYDMIDVSGVFLGDNPSVNVPYSLVDNQLRVSWFNTNPIVVDNNQPLFSIVAFVKENAPVNADIGVKLIPDRLNEIGDQNMAVIPGAGLIAPLFKVMATTVNSRIAGSDINLTLYPNPAMEKVNIAYSIPAEGRVIIEAYDVTGKKMGILRDETQFRGKYTLHQDVNAWAPGIYYITFNLNHSSGEIRLTKKLAVR